MSCWRNTENAGQYHSNVYVTPCNTCHVGGILRKQDNSNVYVNPSNTCHVGGILRIKDNIKAMCMFPIVTCVILEEY